MGYARERKTFGQPIVDYQLVRQMLANMAQSIDIGELLVRKGAGWLKNQGFAIPARPAWRSGTVPEGGTPGGR
ncbi:MAG: acyl-CoA dehydrogenase family protein [Chloroflexota bacterium]